MVREATLDEFGHGGGDDGAGGNDEGDGSAAEEGRHGEFDDDGECGDGATPTPAAITCEWTPDGAACEDCGATVERRWRDGDARVCVDCKEW